MIARTNFNLGVKRDANCLTSPSQTMGRRTKKQREADETVRIANDILSDFPHIIENNLGGSKHGVAVYYKEHVKLLLKRSTTDVGVSPSFVDSDNSYKYNEDRTRSKIVEAYPPEKRHSQFLLLRQKWFVRVLENKTIRLFVSFSKYCMKS